MLGVHHTFDESWSPHYWQLDAKTKIAKLPDSFLGRFDAEIQLPYLNELAGGRRIKTK